MRDDDQLLSLPDLEFGSGVVGVCDVCQVRQAVIVLQKERFKLCVLDFLNKTWAATAHPPGAPLPPYRSERVWFDSSQAPDGRAAAIVLSPTKVVKHPIVLVVPEVYGLTTSLLDAAIRFARAGFEVLLPDFSRIGAVGPADHLSLRTQARFRRGVDLTSPRIDRLVQLHRDALAYLRTRPMVDAEKSAVFGTSYGAVLAVGVACQERRLAAVALAAPIPFRPVERVRLLPGSTLVLVGDADTAARPGLAAFEAAFSSGGVDGRIVTFAGAGHRFLSRDIRGFDEATAERAWAELLTFLKGRLLPAPPKPPPVRTAPATTPPATPAPVTAAAVKPAPAPA